jgi:hypothetical protein
VEDEGGGGGIIEEIVAAITSIFAPSVYFAIFNVFGNTDWSACSINSFPYLWFVTQALSINRVRYKRNCLKSYPRFRQHFSL